MKSRNGWFFQLACNDLILRHLLARRAFFARATFCGVRITSDGRLTAGSTFDRAFAGAALVATLARAKRHFDGHRNAPLRRLQASRFFDPKKNVIPLPGGKPRERL
jgi:hypothetical protein